MRTKKFGAGALVKRYSVPAAVTAMDVANPEGATPSGMALDAASWLGKARKTLGIGAMLHSSGLNEGEDDPDSPYQKARMKAINERRAGRGKPAVSHYVKGGSVKEESKAMMKKEVNFFKKKGAPKAMIKHEEAEMKTAKFAKGGGVESRGKTKGTIIKMAAGGAVKGFARGGGIESRGKTRGKMC